MNLRPSFHIGKQWLRFMPRIALLALTICLAQTQVVQAAVFNPGCSGRVGDVAQLQADILTAGGNGAADTINLVRGCVYILTTTLIVNPDGGNPLTIEGNGATISGNNAVRVFQNSGGRLNLNAVTVSNGAANDGSGGGGILHVNGTLTLTNSTVSGNTSNGSGGGIETGGTLTLINSTLSGNTSSGSGGGIYNGGTLTLTNSTLSGNTSLGRRGGGIFTNGGGIFNNNSGMVTLTNSTLSGNTSVNTEGSGIVNHGTLALRNSILANSTNGRLCVGGGTITSLGGNLVEDGSCGVPGALSGDPVLGGLTGSPAHFPLLSGSPAIDSGDNSICPATDQRGAARPQDGNGDGSAICDLGSYEVDTAPPVTLPPTLDLGVASVPPPPDTPAAKTRISSWTV